MKKPTSVVPKRFQNLLNNIKKIQRLLEIHTMVAGRTTGRKYDVEVLNKVTIVLLVATWEKFIEDLATDAFDVF